MKIYISHSTSYDFKEKLYRPLLSSPVAMAHSLILPHQNSAELYPTERLLKDNECQAVIAEVSRASTGQGIELAWACDAKIPILCVADVDAEPSSALRSLNLNVTRYKDEKEFVELVQRFVDSLVGGSS